MTAVSLLTFQLCPNCGKFQNLLRFFIYFIPVAPQIFSWFGDILFLLVKELWDKKKRRTAESNTKMWRKILTNLIGCYSTLPFYKKRPTLLNYLILHNFNLLGPLTIDQCVKILKLSALVKNSPSYSNFSISPWYCMIPWRVNLPWVSYHSESVFQN